MNNKIVIFFGIITLSLFSFFIFNNNNKIKLVDNSGSLSKVELTDLTLKSLINNDKEIAFDQYCPIAGLKNYSSSKEYFNKYWESIQKTNFKTAKIIESIEQDKFFIGPAIDSNNDKVNFEFSIGGFSGSNNYKYCYTPVLK